jgi:hypothetical protein
VDELPVADVDADVADARLEEDQVAGRGSLSATCGPALNCETV